MTASRYQKIRDVLSQRQTDLTLLLEEVHKPHNVSAVIRSADAIGVHNIHGVWEDNNTLRKGTSLGSQIWVKIHQHKCVKSAISHLKQQDMQVLVTHLDESAVDFRSIDYTKPTAIIMGQEKTGATDEAVALADQSIVVPMVGMVQSLNVSVASAIILYEAQRQRHTAGMYNKPSINEQESQEILFEGGFPVLFNECVRRNLPFPIINDKGCIEASDDWWRVLQFSEER
jgi:tRNA (guanosine-2'-O-)-methyltransferase